MAEPTHITIPFAKRLCDIVVSFVLLCIFSPVAIGILILQCIEGICIPKNRGPVLYAETRISQGSPFTLRKFRTFKTSAYLTSQQNGEIVATKPLERKKSNLTYTGRLLKATYTDELPQLWSVLIGDMSMVGPRPWNPVDYTAEVNRGEYRKKVIRAGLTGLVQLHKRDAQRFGGEHALDHVYIDFVRTHSGIRVVMKDIRILLQSVWFMLKAEGL